MIIFREMDNEPFKYRGFAIVNDRYNGSGYLLYKNGKCYGSSSSDSPDELDIVINNIEDNLKEEQNDTINDFINSYKRYIKCNLKEYGDGYYKYQIIGSYSYNKLCNMTKSFNKANSNSKYRAVLNNDSNKDVTYVTFIRR